MTSHPNRGPKGPASTPTPVQVKEAREAKGLTQTDAAHLIYSTQRAWQMWESGDRRMHPAFWELWQIKAQ